MNTLETIYSRRSVRKFKDEPVEEGKIEILLKAAMSAPSAGNEQPWHFIIITDRESLNAVPEFSPYASMAKDAVLAILVCGDLSLEKYKGFWVEDCSAATQNILLAAQEIGLGAVWTGIYPMADRIDGFRNFFKLPENIIPLAFIPIGYPDEKLRDQDRYKKERIHKNSW